MTTVELSISTRKLSASASRARLRYRLAARESIRERHMSTTMLDAMTAKAHKEGCSATSSKKMRFTDS